MYFSSSNGTTGNAQPPRVALTGSAVQAGDESALLVFLKNDQFSENLSVLDGMFCIVTRYVRSVMRTQYTADLRRSLLQGNNVCHTVTVNPFAQAIHFVYHFSLQERNQTISVKIRRARRETRPIRYLFQANVNFLFKHFSQMQRIRTGGWGREGRRGGGWSSTMNAYEGRKIKDKSSINRTLCSWRCHCRRVAPRCTLLICHNGSRCCCSIELAFAEKLNIVNVYIPYTYSADIHEHIHTCFSCAFHYTSGMYSKKTRARSRCAALYLYICFRTRGDEFDAFFARFKCWSLLRYCWSVKTKIDEFCKFQRNRATRYDRVFQVDTFTQRTKIYDTIQSVTQISARA